MAIEEEWSSACGWPNAETRATNWSVTEWAVVVAIRSMNSCLEKFFPPIDFRQIRIGIRTYRDLYSASGSSGRICPADCESLNSSRTSPSLPRALRKSMI